MGLDFSLSDLEEFVRSGKFGLVVDHLKNLEIKKIPRRQRLALANLCRRVDQLKIGLRILNPVVRPKQHKADGATPLEKIEYGEILRRLGASKEAQTIFASIDSVEYPQNLLSRAFAYFSTWEYDLALPLLRKYVESSQLTPYQILVGRLNLAAALVHLELAAEAMTELQNLRSQTREEFPLLYGHVLELTAQLAIHQGQWDLALDYLAKAQSDLSETGSLGLLWIQKWQGIAISMKKNRVDNLLLSVRQRAAKDRQWEVLRECEFFMAHLRQDRKSLDKIYFGSPFDTYRQRVLKLTEKWYRPAETYVLADGQTLPFRVLDVVTGRLVDGQQIIPVGQVHHHLLIGLCQDFYRPVPIAALFARMFPDEYFNPDSSPGRVYQAIHRLRKSFAEHKIDIAINEIRGSYFLTTSSQVGLKKTLGVSATDSNELKWRLIVQLVPPEFTVRDITASLNISLSSAQRLQRWALKNNYITCHGTGPKIFYRFSEPKIGADQRKIA